MTNEELTGLLDFEEALTTAEIVSEYECAHGAVFVVARLTYNDGDVITVPFVHYNGAEWIFTPWDWQGVTPETPDEIDSITWRVDNTETEGVIFDGLPMLAPWVGEIKNENREMRKRIGAQLKNARETNGISIRALAEQTGVNKSQICRIEAGRLNAGIDTVNRLATALGLTLTLED